MNIVIYGTGAVGGYFGSRLEESGNNVTFIARGEQLKAMRSHGLKLVSPLGNYHVYPAKVTDDFSEVDQVDLVLIAVKTWQLYDVANEIGRSLKRGTIVISLLNGVENHQILQNVLDPSAVLGGFCKVVCKMEGFGCIEHVSYTPEIVFGELNNQITDRALKIQKVFTEAGIKNKMSTNIQRDMWSKFLFISTISALGALTRATVGEMLEQPEVKKIMCQIAEEIEAVAKAMGVDFPSDILIKQFKIIEAQPYQTTSSLQRDIMEGKPSELEAQNGAVLRMGKELGVPTPMNSYVYHSLLIQEKKSRKTK